MCVFLRAFVFFLVLVCIRVCVEYCGSCEYVSWYTRLCETIKSISHISIRAEGSWRPAWEAPLCSASPRTKAVKKKKTSINNLLLRLF